MIAAAGNNDNETSRLLRPQHERQHDIGAEEDEDNEGMFPAALCDDVTSPRHTAYHSLLVVPKNVHPHAVDQDGVAAPRREESSLAAADVDNDDTKLSVGPMDTVRQPCPEILPIGALGMGLIMPSMAAERPAETKTPVVAPAYFGVDTTFIDYCTVEGGGGGGGSSGGTTFSPLIRRESDWAIVHLQLVEDEEMEMTDSVCLPCSSWPLTMTVGVAVLAQMLVGYNIGVMNAPEPVRGCACETIRTVHTDLFFFLLYII
jgi:hypothetical protein